MNKRYFMSYSYKQFPSGESGFGCCTTEEHPIIVVQRWNNNDNGRDVGRCVVLLWWQEVPSDVTIQSET